MCRDNTVGGWRFSIGALSFSARSLALVLSLRVVRAFLSEKLGTLGERHGGPVLLSEKFDFSATPGFGHRGLVLLSEKLDLSAGIGVLSFSARSLTLVPSYASQREASPPYKATLGRDPRLLPWGGCPVGRRYPCGGALSLPRGALVLGFVEVFSPGTSHLFPRPVVVFRADISGSPLLRSVPCSQLGPESTSLMRAR